MNEEQQDVDFGHWLSSYGLITIERILGRYQLRLNAQMMSAVIKNQFSFYHELLQIPLKNVLNGIVIQQAHDYFVYAQKLYIDYLLSSETASPEGSPGASTRDSLEKERKNLIVLGDDFHQLELKQDALISRSQAYLIELVKGWKTELEKAVKTAHKTIKRVDSDVHLVLAKQAVEHVLVHCDLKSPQHSQILDRLNELLKGDLDLEIVEKLLQDLSELIHIVNEMPPTLEEFYMEIREINESARTFRSQMYDAILKAIDLLKLLPVYKIDPAQDEINKETLYFDKSIGETET